MRGVRFKAEEAMKAGAPWRELFDLAKLCEGAGLSCIQAEVVRLTAMNCTAEEIAAHLSLPIDRAQFHGERAERRLFRRQSWLYGALYRDFRDLLACLKNTFNPKPRPFVFRKVPGGFDVVVFSGSAFGTRPEDLIEEPGALLHTLTRLLESRRGDAHASPEA